MRKSAFTGWCTRNTPCKLPVTTFTLPLMSLSMFPTAIDPLSNSSPSPSFVDHHSRARNKDMINAGLGSHARFLSPRLENQQHRVHYVGPVKIFDTFFSLLGQL